MIKKINLFFIFLSISVLVSCIQSKDHNYNQLPNFDTVEIKYAKGFKILQSKDSLMLVIKNPWQGAENIEQKYLLSRNFKKSDANSQIPKIKLPVQRIVCLSTTHIAMIQFIKKTHCIVGISGTHLISDTMILNRIESGAIKDVGYEQSLNYETLLSLKPDLLMAYGVGNDFSAYLSKIKEMGIPVVLNAEYLENHPLAKAEWVKYVAAFFDCIDTANNLFYQIDSSYLHLKKYAQTFSSKPQVLAGLPWNETWYVPGGKSYAAKLIEDAGGEFLWRENHSHEAIPLNIESVIKKASNADIWINAGAANNFKEILAVDSRLKHLKPFKTVKIYNNNKRVSKGGGNDYWENGTMLPHLILKDLICIFHGPQNGNDSLFFYKNIH